MSRNAHPRVAVQCACKIPNASFREEVAVPHDGATYADVARAAEIAFGFPARSLVVAPRRGQQRPLIPDEDNEVPDVELERTYDMSDQVRDVHFFLHLDPEFENSNCPECDCKPILGYVRVFKGSCQGACEDRCDDCKAGFFDRGRLDSYGGDVLYLWLDNPGGSCFACGTCIRKELEKELVVKSANKR
jgi:hypothetical protein